MAFVMTKIFLLPALLILLCWPTSTQQVNIDSVKNTVKNTFKNVGKNISIQECIAEFTASIVDYSSPADICPMVTDLVVCLGSSLPVRHLAGNLVDNVLGIAGEFIKKYACTIDVEEILKECCINSSSHLSSMPILYALPVALLLARMVHRFID